MKKLLFVLSISIALVSCSDDTSNEPIEVPTPALALTPTMDSNVTVYDGYTLAWNDEFLGADIDPLTWG
jgi:hypothetical protein